MKKRLLFLLPLFLFFIFSQIILAVPYPIVSAQAAVLMNADTGALLYSKNTHTELPQASTTKIMTAVLALEKGDLNKTVTVYRDAAYREGSSMHLRYNEQKTLRELLYGLMLVSGNDAATAIADAIAGSESKFAVMMTEKARELGLKNTAYKNASGLPAEGHYSSAYDLALLTKYAMNNGNFAVIVKTKEKTVSGTRPGRIRNLVNHNKLLWRYPYTTGVKTGYTQSAGGCLVASATCQDVTLIAVVLNTKKTYEDCLRLFDFGFRQCGVLE